MHTLLEQNVSMRMRGFAVANRMRMRFMQQQLSFVLGANCSHHAIRLGTRSVLHGSDAQLRVK